jgi:hypothetical protein
MQDQDDSALCFWLEYGGRRLVLTEGVTTIGRAANCQLVLDDALVSRRHAQLVTGPEGVRVDDLGSSNGVHVNGKRITESAQLKAGDVLKVGEQSLVLRAGPATRRHVPPSRFAAKTLTGVEAAHLLGRGGDPFDGDTTNQGRALLLLGGVADKVLALGRGEEAERVLAGFLDRLVEGLQEGRDPEGDTAEKAVEYAVRLAAATGKGRWVDYCFELFAMLEKPLPTGVVDELYTVLRKVDSVDRKNLRSYVAVLHAQQGRFGPAERFLVQRIEGLERLAAAK